MKEPDYHLLQSALHNLSAAEIQCHPAGVVAAQHYGRGIFVGLETMLQALRPFVNTTTVRLTLLGLYPPDLDQACIPEGLADLLASDPAAPGVAWQCDPVQFARLIEEAQGQGAFTTEVVAGLCESMELDPEDIHNLLDRAQRSWEAAKARNCPPRGGPVRPEGTLIMSIDDGTTWVPLDQPVRFRYAPAEEESEAEPSCHLRVSDEGLVIDVVAEGAVLGTNSEMFEEVITRLTPDPRPATVADACPYSPTGLHEPAWDHVFVEENADSESCYIDVHCKHCGTTGCIGSHETLADKISW